uniref:Uncharacterized protein n=1 Tax=Glossina pallidipes TaxID=7398 RepID=A0A1B0AIL3_GLOPL
MNLLTPPASHFKVKAHLLARVYLLASRNVFTLERLINKSKEIGSLSDLKHSGHSSAPKAQAMLQSIDEPPGTSIWQRGIKIENQFCEEEENAAIYLNKISSIKEFIELSKGFREESRHRILGFSSLIPLLTLAAQASSMSSVKVWKSGCHDSIRKCVELMYRNGYKTTYVTLLQRIQSLSKIRRYLVVDHKTITSATLGFIHDFKQNMDSYLGILYDVIRNFLHSGQQSLKRLQIKFIINELADINRAPTRL